MVSTQQESDRLLIYSEWDFIATHEIDVPWQPYPIENLQYHEDVLRPLYREKRCPMCGEAVAIEEQPAPTAMADQLANFLDYERMMRWGTDLITCACCGWWLAYSEGHSLGHGSYDRLDVVHVGKLKTFDLSDLSAPLFELRRHFKTHPERLYSVSPRAFERLVCDCLGDHFDCEARHVGGPGDEGIDIILVEKDKPVLVQVKRRADPASVESVQVVRELLGVLLLQNQYEGIVVSTARRFSRAAVRAVSFPRIRSRGYNVKLYDYDAVLSLLSVVHRAGRHPAQRLWTDERDTSLRARIKRIDDPKATVMYSDVFGRANRRRGRAGTKSSE